MAILVVFAFTAVSSYAQRSGRGEGSRNRTSATVSPRQNHGESVRKGAPSHSQRAKAASGRPARPVAAPHHAKPHRSVAHRHPVHSAHHYRPVRPVAAHHVHGRPHYVKHIDRGARPFFVDNCRYYHHKGAFYKYYPGHGYGLVSIPFYSSFPALPFPCRRVVLGTDVYWEGDGSWFYETSGGYVLVEAPAAPVYEAAVVPVPVAPAVPVVPVAPVVVPARPHVSVSLSF